MEAFDTEYVDDYTKCDQLRSGLVRGNKLPAGVNNVSQHGHPTSTGALQRADLCVWTPNDPLCRNPKPVIHQTHRAVRQHYVQSQQNSFRSMETVRVHDAKRAAELMQARCTRITTDHLKPKPTP